MSVNEWTPRQLTVLAGMLFAGILAVFMEQGVKDPPRETAPNPASVFAARSPVSQVPKEVMDSMSGRASSSVMLRTLGAPVEDFKDSVVDVSTRTAAEAPIPSPTH